MRDKGILVEVILALGVSGSGGCFFMTVAGIAVGESSTLGNMVVDIR